MTQLSSQTNIAIKLHGIAHERDIGEWCELGRRFIVAHRGHQFDENVMRVDGATETIAEHRSLKEPPRKLFFLFKRVHSHR